MSQRRTVALVAGVATLLSSTVLSTLFELYAWFGYCLFVTVIVTAVAMLSRAARFPVWAQALAMLAGLTVFLTSMFPSGHEIARIIPTGQTIAHFHALLNAAGKDIRELSVPVSDHVELNFLVAAGIGLVAVAVDLLAVGLRHPALAGLPLLAVYSVPVAIHTSGVSWIPFSLGAAGYLWLLITDHVDRVRRWGRRFRGDGRDVDSWEPSPLAASGRRVGFAGLVIAIVLPFLIPGMNAGLLQRLSALGSSVGEGGSGSQGNSLSPFVTLSGHLNKSATQNLFTFTTNQKNEDDIPYLRTAVADVVTDQGFQPHPLNGERLEGGTKLKTATTAVKGHKYRAVVTTQHLDDRYLSLFSNPVQVNAPRQVPWYYDQNTGVVYADRNGTEDTQYNFSYQSYNFTGDELAGAPPVQTDDALYRTNTEVRPNQFIANQVDKLTKDKFTEYAKVMAIYDSFSTVNGFSYQLSTKTGTSGSDIQDFLTNKQGYCEQFSAAMAWMVRQAHIPARVVVGYRLGNENSKHVFQVTNKEAHAWVEVWFPTFGWVPFDPTPGSGLAGAQTFEWTTPQTTPTDGNTTTGPTVAPTGPDQTGATDGPTHGPAAVTATGGPHQRLPQWPFWTLGVLVVLALLAVPALRRAQLRRNRHRLEERAALLTADAPPPEDPDPDAGPAVGGLTVGGQTAWQSASRRAAHAAWDELMDTLVDFGMPVDESETPRATAERLIHRPRLSGRAADSARLLARAEERARYAREPLATGDLSPSFREVRAGLADHVTRRRRLGALLFPRSVARRWRAAVSGAFLGVLATTSTAQHRLLRTLSVRRLLAARSR